MFKFATRRRPLLPRADVIKGTRLVGCFWPFAFRNLPFRIVQRSGLSRVRDGERSRAAGFRHKDIHAERRHQGAKEILRRWPIRHKIKTSQMLTKGINTLPGPIKPLEGPIYAISYDDLSRVYEEATTLARKVGDQLLQEANCGANMEAHYFSYAPINAELSGEPPAPPEEFDYVSMLALLTSRDPEDAFIGGKATLVQRANPLEIDQWVTSLSQQGIQIIDRFSIDLRVSENISRVCAKLFMLPHESVWAEIKKNRFEVKIFSEDAKQELAPLIILSKMKFSLPWCLEGSGSWHRLFESL